MAYRSPIGGHLGLSSVPRSRFSVSDLIAQFSDIEYQVPGYRLHITGRRSQSQVPSLSSHVSDHKSPGLEFQVSGVSCQFIGFKSQVTDRGLQV